MRGKRCLILMQMKLGTHATAVCVRDLGCWCDHTCKHIQTGLSCDRCSCILAMQSNIKTHPFSWPVFRQSGMNWRFYSGAGRQELEVLGWPTLGWLLGNLSGVFPEGRRSKVTQLTPRRETALAQIYSKLIEEEPRWNRLAKSWCWDVKAENRSGIESLWKRLIYSTRKIVLDVSA